MPLVPAQAFLDNHAAVNDRMQKELLTMQVRLALKKGKKGQVLFFCARHIFSLPCKVACRWHGRSSKITP
jgi:hypothetical protein